MNVVNYLSNLAIPITILLILIYNMEDVLNLADLVVARSGAMTITEVAKCGKPAIFIPYPYATENHQEYNAKVLEKIGAARIVHNEALETIDLNKYIEELRNKRYKVDESLLSYSEK